MPSFQRFCLQLSCLLCLAFFASPAAVAQESGVVGIVTDSSGAALVGATVTAKNVNTGETRQVTSSDVGRYTIPGVQAGLYQVSAQKEGFQRKVIDQVVLEVQAMRTLNLMLSPGAVSEQVNVMADPTALQTTESSVGTLLETKVVNEIPLNGRNFLQLQLLTPGVTMGRGGTFTAVQIAAQNTSIGGGNFSVNGMRDVYNDYLLDGVSFKDWIHGTNGMNPSVDAIQEFRLQSSNYTAEFGSNAGGLVNMVIKSGSNKFHGTVYEFLRNDKFDAENYFTARAGEKKPPLRRNQFGATLGGPIMRNKNFFFLSYDGFREQRTITLFDTFPTKLMHSGDFSELLALPTPIIIHDPATGIPYANNKIPANAILSVMPGYLDKYVPLPNRPGLVNNEVVPGTHSNNINQFIGRLDQKLTSKLQMSAHYAFNDIKDSPAVSNPSFPSSTTPSFSTVGFGGVSGGSNKQNNRNQNINIQLNDNINPSTIAEFKVGYNRFNQYVVQEQLQGPNVAKDILGINGVSTDPRGALRSWFSERYEYSGSVNLVRGNHYIRTGIQTVRHHETFPEIIIPYGIYVFDGTFTGYSMADMLSGIPSQFLLSPEVFDPQFREWDIMPWVQDDWRVTSKLTLNLGLRYERRPYPISRNNTISNLILPPGGGTASVVLSGPCVPNLPVRRCETSLPTSIAKERSTLGKNDNNNFAPRVGFVYKLGNSDNTVIRGAYGIFYQGEPFNQFVSLSYNPPFVSFYSLFNNTANYKSFDWYHPAAGLPPGGIQFTYIPADSPSPYLQAWNLAIQRDLGAGVVLDIAYVGNKDTKLWARTWPNQPRPGPGDVDSRRPYTNVGVISGNEAVGNANYNGLQVKAERRFSRGLSLLSSYTWSKAITDSQLADNGSFVPDLQDNRNRRGNRGLWSADTRHRFTLSSLIELPFGRGRKYLSGTRGITGKLVSGWQVGAIGTLQSGQPLTVTLPYDNSNVGEGSKLPNVVGNPNNGPKTLEKFFNTDAFVAPPQYTFGNEGIGSVTGPGLGNLDASVVKNTTLFREINMQFRVEAFNVANHAILGDPNTDFGTPLFGQITSTRLDNRELQLAVKLSF